MRDPARIDKILSVIKFIWEENPDLRLGQLLYSAIENFDDYYLGSNVFLIEDDQLLDDLEGWAREIEIEN